MPHVINDHAILQLSNGQIMQVSPQTCLRQTFYFSGFLKLSGLNMNSCVNIWLLSKISCTQCGQQLSKIEITLEIPTCNKSYFHALCEIMSLFAWHIVLYFVWTMRNVSPDRLHLMRKIVWTYYVSKNMDTSKLKSTLVIMPYNHLAAARQ